MDCDQCGTQLAESTLGGGRGSARRRVLATGERAVGGMGKLIEVVADAAELDVQAGEIDPAIDRGRSGKRGLAQIHGGTQPG